MKDFYRDQNVNGNRYIWRYTDDAGEMQFVPCDKHGWICVNEMMPSIRESGLSMPCKTCFTSNKGRQSHVCADTDFRILDKREFWLNAPDPVIGWQPSPSPMKIT